MPNRKLIRSKVIPCNIEHFRAAMERLGVLHRGRWVSSEGLQLEFEEYRHIREELVTSSLSAEELASVPPALDCWRAVWQTGLHSKYYKEVDITPPSRGSWAIILRSGTSQPVEGRAGIEAYERPEGTTRVDFLDGYLPGARVHRSKWEPIGSAFEEFCQMVIEEAQAADDGSDTDDRQDVGGGSAVSAPLQRTGIFRGSIAHFRALMRRLKHLHTDGWESSTGDRLAFWENTVDDAIPTTASWTVYSVSLIQYKAVDDPTDSTMRTDWIVEGCAVINAYEESSERTRIVFQDGRLSWRGQFSHRVSVVGPQLYTRETGYYFRKDPSDRTKAIAIGSSFEEFCEMVIREAGPDGIAAAGGLRPQAMEPKMSREASKGEYRETDGDPAMSSRKLIRSEVIPISIEQFRAVMERLEILHGGVWVSSNRERLYFSEHHREKRELVAVSPLSEHPITGAIIGPQEHYRQIDTTPLGRATWSVRTGFNRVEPLPTGTVFRFRDFEALYDDNWIGIMRGGGFAGIEAYGRSNGYTQVDFLDGYAPEGRKSFYLDLPGEDEPLLCYASRESNGWLAYSDRLPIGPAFEEFCQMVIEEAWAAAGGNGIDDRQEAKGSFAVSDKREIEALQKELGDLVDEGEELGIPGDILCELRKFGGMLEAMPDEGPMQVLTTVLTGLSMIRRCVDGLNECIKKDERIDASYYKEMQGAVFNLSRELARLTALTGATEQVAGEDGTDGVIDIDRLLSDVSQMRQHYKGYNPITAREIIEAAPKAARSFCEEGGRWGPSKFEPFCGVTSVTIGRYFKAFRAVGLKETPDGIRIPGRGVGEPY
jgi:hypothetical protein